MPRIAVVDPEKLRDKHQNLYIQSICPVNREGKECIRVDAKGRLSIDEKLCIGCGICVLKSPKDSIHIINLPEELDSPPIHRYGENGFHLYSLPQPSFGKVVGVLGVNGIGKSTAIKILAGILKPNLGKDTEAGFSDLVQFFKGTEAQAFFEGLQKGKIKVSYKPQQVEIIPKKAKGTVRHLLQKVDERGKFDDIVEKLQLGQVLDHDITSISGGELQRVAVAATALKKANLYIFDELTSYLDIKQRLRTASFIRELATPETAVLVIEHDLIALDYIADVIHIMYGKPAVYGIASLPKTTKAGINVYLEGHIKEHNMRFRDHAILFDVRPPSKSQQREILTSWSGIRKTLGAFTLTAEAGSISQKEIVGVLGENGIGKTTLARILSHVLKPDAGQADERIKISYKPQYLEPSEYTVREALAKVLEKHQNDIIGPLNLDPLLDMSLEQLSGGELQRVAIAAALAKDCDMFLLDEPSAYLDVEQRITTAKVIENVVFTTGKSCLVIDHDLLFLDVLSDRLLVFEGSPAVEGRAKGPYAMEQGMNSLLSGLKITLRRDELSHRPRINKPESQKDQAQKAAGKYYYS